MNTAARPIRRRWSDWVCRASINVDYERRAYVLAEDGGEGWKEEELILEKFLSFATD